MPNPLKLTAQKTRRSLAVRSAANIWRSIIMNTRLLLAVILLFIVSLSLLFVASCNRPNSSAERLSHKSQPLTSERVFIFSPMPLNDKQQISCRSIARTYIGQGNVLAANGGLHLPKEAANRILGQIEEGSDVLSIRIEHDYLVFLTKASFESGIAEGSRFPLIENTSDYLKAWDSSSSGVAILESFVLNKNNGLAIWTRVRPSGFFGQKVPAAPDSDTIYFRCQ
jgi:hypothetical protein